jgi:dipeptide/tripeptide permease
MFVFLFIFYLVLWVWLFQQSSIVDFHFTAVTEGPVGFGFSAPNPYATGALM